MENSKGHTILLVDDEPDILEFLSYNIRKEGYKVFTANNGEEGVKLAQQLSPSLILLDVMMPKMDGIETCQIIRKDLNITQPIIAFLTSRAEDYAQIAGFEAGADDYISKPIRPRLLLSKIESLLRRLDKSKGITSVSILFLAINSADRFSNFSFLLATNTKLKFKAANCIANSAPIPDEAPVINAHFPYLFIFDCILI